MPKLTASREELKVMSGDLLVDVVESYMKHMRAGPVRVSSKRASFIVIMPVLCLFILAEALKPGYTVEALNMNDTHLLPLILDLEKPHAEPTESDWR